MSDRKDNRPYGPPVEQPPKRGGLLDETRGLFDQLVGEAQRRQAAERAATPPRGPVGKALLGALVLAALFAAGTMFYGVITYPDAPVRETASGYAGKGGKPYSRAQYESFKTWERTLFGAFVVAFGIGFVTLVEEHIRKRRRNG